MMFARMIMLKKLCRNGCSDNLDRAWMCGRLGREKTKPGKPIFGSCTCMIPDEQPQTDLQDE